MKWDKYYSDLVRIWKMTITAYWKVIHWDFPIDTDINHEKPQSGQLAKI
jgi:hypothetical protein